MCYFVSHTGIYTLVTAVHTNLINWHDRHYLRSKFCSTTTCIACYYRYAKEQNSHIITFMLWHDKVIHPSDTTFIPIMPNTISTEFKLRTRQKNYLLIIHLHLENRGRWRHFIIMKFGMAHSGAKTEDQINTA